VVIGYLIPMAYGPVASLGVWALAFGGFPNLEFVHSTADAFGMDGAADWFVILFFVVLTGTVDMMAGVVACPHGSGCRRSPPSRSRSASRRPGCGQPQPMDAVHFHALDDRQRVHQVDRPRLRLAFVVVGRGGRSVVLAEAP
jgi:hypothetical protein